MRIGETRFEPALLPSPRAVALPLRRHVGAVALTLRRRVSSLNRLRVSATAALLPPSPSPPSQSIYVVVASACEWESPSPVTGMLRFLVMNY
ncbi:hypothetical protein PIB30_030745 [Stylosanthes scabra]|uniref:Uncharacterized protein n=1 Tax=Stylosanthes scabra TaxID=79078 RepID=A0ABU6WCU8_9FABA|nr:hypothetical protein [Stylosanthes scabra]